MLRQFDAFSSTLTSVTMGIDAFERTRTRGDGLLDAEGLVPIYLGAGLIEARRYSNWPEIETDLVALAARLDEVTPASRRVFAAMLRSLQAVVRCSAAVRSTTPRR